MCKTNNIFNGRRWLRNLLIGVLIVVTLGAAVGGIVALSRNTDKIDEALTYTSIGWTKYSIGGLAPSNGAYMSTDHSIYTEKAFECQGLNVTPVFESDVSYQIYFYDQNNEFVHTTGRLTGAFVQDSVPFFAKYARIVITPNDDNKVTIFEKRGYAKQLEVKVYREQGYKNFTEDLFDTELTGAYSLSNSTGELVTLDDSSNYKVCRYIDVKGYKDVLFFRTDNASMASRVTIYCYDGSKTLLGHIGVGDYADEFISSTGVGYYLLDLSSLDYEPSFLRTYVNANWDLKIHCR